MTRMIQILFKLILCVLLAIAAAFAYVAVKSGDPLYAFYEWMSPARFHQYDRLIRSVALEHHLDPMLVKAVVWRESRFDPEKQGSHGERGLMQVTERAANEWARENKGAVETTLPRYRNASFFKRSIFPRRVDTSSRLSTATNSINAAGRCDEKQRVDYQSRCVSRFSTCAVRMSN